MTTTIKIKSTTTAGKVPTTSDLEIAELGLNLADEKLYSRNSSGIFEIGKPGEVPSGGTPDRPTSPELGDLFYDITIDTLLYWNGTEWVPVGNEAIALNDLSDVDTTGVTDGMVIAYDQASGIWKPVSPASLSVDVDLGYTPSATDGEVTNTAGDNATIPGATATDAGLLTAEDKRKLDGIQEGAEANPDLTNYLQKGDNVSDLVNDAGYLTESDIPDDYLQKGDNVSDLVNDAGYITDADVGDGRISITKADGTEVGFFTTNQDAPKIIALPADVVPSAPGDGKLTIKDAEGTTLGEFTADQATGTDTEVTLPAIGDGTITIVDADGDPVGEFTVNQAGDTEISLPEIPTPEDQIHIGDTYPGTPSTGDLWVDTSECPPVLQIWSDCEDPDNPGWTPIGGGGADAITFTAVITDDGTPAANTPGHILTASATSIQGGTAPAEYEYKWLVDGLTMGQAKTINIISTFVGKIVSCEITVAEPDGSDPVTKTAIYSKTIEAGVEIKQPEVLTPEKGAGIGGDVTYTPETSAITFVQTPGSVIINQNGTTYHDYGVYLDDGSNITDTSRYTEVIAKQSYFTPELNDPLKPDKGLYLFEQTARLQYTGFSVGTTIDLVIASGKAAGGEGVRITGDIQPHEDIQIPVDHGTAYLPKVLVTVTVTEASGTIYIQATQDANNGITGADSSIFICYIQYLSDAITLTFTNDKAYDSADGTEMTTIDQAFKAGNKVVGKGDATVFANTAAFSTTLYEGNGGTKTVPTGIDNTVKALIWIKDRDNAYTHVLCDTINGPGTRLRSNTTDKLQTDSASVSEFLSNGYKMETADTAAPNSDGANIVAWNFRAAPAFLDIVTYEGDGVAGLEIPHSLGTKPNCLIIKSTSHSSDWIVHHTGLKRFDSSNWWNNKIWLNLNSAENSLGSNDLDNTEPTETVFTLGDNSDVNASGRSYVAYLFADTPGLIKCGKYTPTANEETFRTGFKVGWIIVKNTTTTNTSESNGTNWMIFDRSRISNEYLQANTSREERGQTVLHLDDTDGFTISAGSAPPLNETGSTYIYVAIAEGAQAGQFMPTGVLTEDADKTNKQMTLTDVTGEWKPGFTAVNTEEVTENAPCGDDIVFTSSKPETTSGTVTTWGDATWELTNKETNDKQTASVTLQGNVESETGPTTFTLADDTNYSVRVQYSSADPAAGPSAWSEVNNFKTCGKQDGWYVVDGDPPNSKWQSVTYGNGKFVAVGKNEAQNQDIAMVSADGVDWEAKQMTNTMTNWNNVAYGNGVFVAGGSFSYSQYQLAYSEDDGNTWKTDAVNVEGHDWKSIVYGDGKFVAVAYDLIFGETNYNKRVMYSTDGKSWSNSGVTGVPNIRLDMIAYGDGKYVAVSRQKETNNIIVSTNGTTWTTNTNLPGKELTAIAYGEPNGSPMWVVLAEFKEIWYSSDLTTWQKGVGVPTDIDPYVSITYGDGKFVVLSRFSGLNRGLHSTDGINWSAGALPEDNDWRDVTYGGDKFVAVGYATSPAKPVMYSETGTSDPATTLFYDENNAEAVNDVTLERRYGVDANDTNLRKQGIYPLTEQPEWEVDTYVKEGDAYNPVRDYTSEINAANATIEELRTSNADLQSRLSSLEADEVNDDATDTLLINTVADLLERVEELEGGG